ncbi:MAG: biotin/lipoate A/B protein ligase family protein [Pirellulales bacterium]
MRQRSATDGPTCWLDVELPTVAENLALDEALLDQAHEAPAAATLVRTWMAAEPVVVLGSSSSVGGEVDAEACRSEGVRVIRRPSGGLTVVLGPGCLMWSVIASWPTAVPAIDAIHAAMLEPLCTTLAAAGRPVVRRGSSDLAMTVDGCDRKISGNALRVRRRAVLYHGTLLDDFDLGIVSRVLRHPPREPDYRAHRDHATFLANLGLGRATLEATVRRAFGAEVIRSDWPADRVAQLVRDRYLDEAWTHRLA